MAYRLTRQDLIRQLRDQVAFLRASGASFDAGMESEAKRLATTIRVLIHDTARSQSPPPAGTNQPDA
jgi:peptide subunit release factor RF-3